MKSTKSEAQRKFEEIQNEDLSGATSDQLRARLEIVHNAFDEEFKKTLEITERINANTNNMSSSYWNVA